MHDLDGIAASFAEYGYADTVVIDERTARTISGHGRVEALQLMRTRGDDPPDGIHVARDGTWALPVNRGWRSRDDAHAEGYLLSANRWTEKGGYDFELLAEIVRDLEEQDASLLDAAGYDELDRHDLLDAYLDRDPAPPAPGGLSGGYHQWRTCPECGHRFEDDV